MCGEAVGDFYSSFVKEDGHGILYRDGINVFEGYLMVGIGILK